MNKHRGERRRSRYRMLQNYCSVPRWVGAKFWQEIFSRNLRSFIYKKKIGDLKPYVHRGRRSSQVHI